MPHESPAYIIEFTRIGGQVKVVACDSETGLEAAVIVPANASQQDMTTLAVRKLRYLIDKKSNPDG